MIIKKNGSYSVTGGDELFISNFQGRTRRVRCLAHQRLVRGLNERGFYRNGEQPYHASASDAKNFGQLMESIKAGLDQLEKPGTETKFYGNPKTGQKIPLDVICGATLLWPLEEVLSMIPSRSSKPNLVDQGNENEMCG